MTDIQNHIMIDNSNIQVKSMCLGGGNSERCMHQVSIDKSGWRVMQRADIIQLLKSHKIKVPSHFGGG